MTMNIYTFSPGLSNSFFQKQGRVAGGAAQAKPAPAPSSYFFLLPPGAIASLAAFATRNFTTVFAAILIAWPVAGFLPMRALRFAFTSRPRPGITNTPFFLVSWIAVLAS